MAASNHAKPLKIYAHDHRIFIYENGGFQRIDEPDEAQKAEVARAFQYFGSRIYIDTLITNLGYVCPCKDGTNIEYGQDYILCTNERPHRLYVINLDVSYPDVSVSRSEMLLGWSNGWPQLTYLNEKTLFVSCAGTEPMFWESSEGKEVASTTMSYASFFTDDMPKSVFYNTFPLLGAIYDPAEYMQSKTKVFQTLCTYKSLFQQDGVSKEMIQSIYLTRRRTSPGCVQMDFTKYKPLHKCLGISEDKLQILDENLQALIVPESAKGPGKREESWLANYFLLYLLRTQQPGCFKQDILDILSVVKDSFFFSRAVNEACTQNIPLQALLDHVQAKFKDVKADHLDAKFSDLYAYILDRKTLPKI